MAQLVGYMVESKDAAIGFIPESDAGKEAVKPFYIPRSKIQSFKEGDCKSRAINTAHGMRNGVLCSVVVCDAFLAKVQAKIAA